MSHGNTTIVTAIVAALVGGLLGFFLGNAGGVLPGGRVAELEAQIERARRFFPTVSELRTLSGTVQSISGSTITINADQSPNPLESWPQTRTITVGDATRIIAQVPKDPAVYQQELSAYQRQLGRQTSVGTAPANPLNIATPPLMFEEKEIGVDDIAVGSRITADAAENIKEASRFEATRIMVQSSAQAGIGIPAGPGGVLVPPPIALPPPTPPGTPARP